MLRAVLGFEGGVYVCGSCCVSREHVVKCRVMHNLESFKIFPPAHACITECLFLHEVDAHVFWLHRVVSTALANV